MSETALVTVRLILDVASTRCTRSMSQRLTELVEVTGGLSAVDRGSALTSLGVARMHHAMRLQEQENAPGVGIEYDPEEYTSPIEVLREAVAVLTSVSVPAMRTSTRFHVSCPE